VAGPKGVRLGGADFLAKPLDFDSFTLAVFYVLG
jgi:ActR/RegA family two-component response regulator